MVEEVWPLATHAASVQLRVNIIDTRNIPSRPLTVEKLDFECDDFSTQDALIDVQIQSGFPTSIWCSSLILHHTAGRLRADVVNGTFYAVAASGGSSEARALTLGAT
jgi:hypothetical protein